MVMGLQLAQSGITQIEPCVGKDLLTYVDYPDAGRRCFSRPQYLVDRQTLQPIEMQTFPELGVLPMTIAETSSPQKMKGRFGDIVIMKINDGHIHENRFYIYGTSSQGEEYYKFNGIIDPDRTRGRSQIEFTKLRQHPLSSVLVQVMRIQDFVSFETQITEALHPVSRAADPQTKLIVIEYADGAESMYYGPFEFSLNSDGSFRIDSSSIFDRKIAAFDITECKTSIELKNLRNDTVATFISFEEMRAAFGNATVEYDWLPDGELLAVIAKVARSEPINLTKAQARALRAKIQDSSELSATFMVTDERVDRMLRLIGNAEAWNDLPDELKKGALASAPSDLLAEYVLKDENFQSFYDRVIENQSVRLEVDKRRMAYTAEIEGLKHTLENMRAEQGLLQEQIDELTDQRDERILEQTREIDRLTIEKREELEGLAAQVEEAELSLKQAQDDKAVVTAQIRSVVRSMTNDMTLSTKILENEMIRQIVQAIAPAQTVVENGTGDQAPKAPAKPECQFIYSFGEHDDQASPKEVLQEIYYGITELADRELTANEVANLLICTTQGYITTLAGLPGTGKTSLAEILAGVLGLTNPASPRFCELSVEKGWTSYRDYIGYFNPFKNGLEKTNAEVFDAFLMLERESAADGVDKVPPYLFLLDEANLSSIEHYWSPFLRACDTFAKADAVVPLGGSEVLRVPQHVRWLATVNFDYTTEELSPRFLDRSWVIRLDSKSFDFENEELNRDPHDFGSQPAFSYGTLLRAFGVRSDAAPAQAQQTKLREVLEVCAKHSWAISPRSKRMIGNYIQTAAELMDMSTAESAYAPVDFAVSQKVLPQLSGSAERLKGLVDDLVAIGGLPHMAERLTQMQELGEDSGFYQYFV